MSDLDRLEELAKMVQSMALCGLGKSASSLSHSTMKHFREEYEKSISGTRSARQRSTSLRQFHINGILYWLRRNVPRTVLKNNFRQDQIRLIILIMMYASSAAAVDNCFDYNICGNMRGQIWAI